jgi:hypothetical protein
LFGSRADTRFAALQNTPLVAAGIALEKTPELHVVRYSRCVTFYECVAHAACMCCPLRGERAHVLLRDALL